MATAYAAATTIPAGVATAYAAATTIPAGVASARAADPSCDGDVACHSRTPLSFWRAVPSAMPLILC
eukprot:gene264-biopygen2129